MKCQLRHPLLTIKGIIINTFLNNRFNNNAILLGFRYDKIIGLVDRENNISPKFADHVLVFMARGCIRSGNSQYVFTLLTALW